MNIRQRVSTVIQSSANVALVGVFIAFTAQSALGDDAAKVLKAMTDYTAAQKSISATFDSDIEVVTPELEKVQFTSSGKLQLTRPDKRRSNEPAVMLTSNWIMTERRSRPTAITPRPTRKPNSPARSINWWT